MAMPEEFARGMNLRVAHYGPAWGRIGQAFPELHLWLVDTQAHSVRGGLWADWSPYPSGGVAIDPL